LYFVGIDVGSLTAEAVLVCDDRLIGHSRIGVRPHPVASAREVCETLFQQNGVRLEQVDFAVSTGYGREQVQAAGMAGDNISEISCHAFGAHCLVPEVRTVVDIGGQDAKAIRVGPAGELEDFVMNDKCAAGTGHFLELMSRALDVPLEELGPLGMRARRPAEMSSRCSIFVETEVIHYLQRGVAREDVAAGINQAMAGRVASLVKRIKPQPALVMTGGVAKNIGVRTEIERRLRLRVTTLKLDPQLVGAYGAAMLARRAWSER